MEKGKLNGSNCNVGVVGIGEAFLAFGSVSIYIFLYSINSLMFHLCSLGGLVLVTWYIGDYMVFSIMPTTKTVGLLSSN